MHQFFKKKRIDSSFSDKHPSMERTLTVKDLTMLGIAAVIGAGIFSTIGKAAYDGGPGVIVLFVISAITCGFTALCYAEFASRVPTSGSAYTYSYVTFGELVAWIIGWSLILEYAIGNVVVAISWSSYFDNLLKTINIHIPEWLLTDPRTAKAAFEQGIDNIAYRAYTTAPMWGGWKIIMNIPAFLIVAIITILAYIGIKESKRSASAMVYFKLGVLAVVIIMGAMYINADNYQPFFPNGIGGVMMGVSAVFYAYIGFDAISTTAEECKNPQRDLPKGMIYSLIICTIIYMIIALVLTGMVNYKEFFQVSDPLAFVFEGKSEWLNKLISFSAIIATTGVLLVFQIGQPRIWMSMSRDGLMPKKFGSIHKKYKTPHFATIITGILVGIPALFIDADLVTDLTSIGTLFAFAIVCAGVLFLPPAPPEQKFKIPYFNSRIWLPIIFVIFYYFNWDRIVQLNISTITFQELLFMIYVVLSIIILAWSIIKKMSLIPILGLLCCLYLMIEIPQQSWWVFLIWMIIGLLIYLLYGYRNSKLRNG